ncbi:unnamed protein product, partial [Anisakis simplex]|uniref:PKNX2 protein n=1 Tax=Anisakis simplex TaxID=6269 RepID=A0A0M3JMQ2_ANISI
MPGTQPVLTPPQPNMVANAMMRTAVAPHPVQGGFPPGGPVAAAAAIASQAPQMGSIA